MMVFGGFPVVNSIVGFLLETPETFLLPVSGWLACPRAETGLVEGLG